MDKRISSRSQFWHVQVFSWKFAEFLISFFKPQVSFSANFISLFSTMKDNSSVLFYLIKYILCSKEPIKLKTFATIDCSGQSLSNSSYQFWNDKLIPYQILHHSLVSWKITTMYFFSSNNIYFAQKERMKVNIFETFKWSSQN